MIEFQWDLQKAETNTKKHGISFEEAKTVFYDEKALLINDPDHSEIEDRYILLGMSHKIRLLVVCHCYPEREDTIRIISVRKASKTEQMRYKESLQ
ncbi:MAG: BrnT family toxin [Desulfobacteraceae bacterium]|nr:MAG: BrnT family toxin [Desulfobacteraceae bacterium]